MEPTVTSPDYVTLLLIAALAVSELLASIPALKSNSIITLVLNVVKKLLGR